MLMAVIAQFGFAQIITNTQIESSEIKSSDRRITLDKRAFTNAIYSNNKTDDIFISIPYISIEPVLLKPYHVVSESLLSQQSDIRVYRYSEGQDHGIITITNDYIYISNNNLHNPIMISPDFESENSYILSTNGTKEVTDGFNMCGNTNDSRHSNNHGSTLADVRDLKSFGSELRIYDLALVVTGEYFQANGNTNNTVRPHAINAAANISDIFTIDLSVMFNVVDVKLNNNPATDNFDPSLERTQQAHDEIVAQYPLDSYDIGHVFHNHQDGDGWSTGGVAQTPAVCVDFEEFKARGWSGSFNNNTVGWIQLAAHEFGHMFGANHTFNGSGDLACSGAIDQNAAYEIGSGTTIMSYNDLCEDDQNIPSSGEADSYFHVHSLLQMMSHIESTDCATISNSFSNTPPEIEVNPCNLSYQIPRGTPFIMSAEGSDADGDLVEYTWEQYDEDGAGTPTIGDVGSAAAGNTVGPLFRSFPPTPEISRSFPDRNTVISGNASDPFQVLPGVQRILLMMCLMPQLLRW